MGMWNGAATMEMVWQFPPKLNIKLQYSPATPLLAIYPKEAKARTQTELCAHVHSGIIHNSQ